MSGTVPSRSTTSNRAEHAIAGQLLLQYVGFADTPARREYVLLARLGDETRQYTVWIDQAAFASRQALRQDGPDICYQKLRRELAESLDGKDHIGVTEGDLASYREAHTPKGRI
jgi:hypothetical protein